MHLFSVKISIQWSTN